MNHVCVAKGRRHHHDDIGYVDEALGDGPVPGSRRVDVWCVDERDLVQDGCTTGHDLTIDTSEVLEPMTGGC